MKVHDKLMYRRGEGGKQVATLCWIVDEQMMMPLKESGTCGKPLDRYELASYDGNIFIQLCMSSQENFLNFCQPIEFSFTSHADSA